MKGRKRALKRQSVLESQRKRERERERERGRERKREGEIMLFHASVIRICCQAKTAIAIELRKSQKHARTHKHTNTHRHTDTPTHKRLDMQNNPELDSLEGSSSEYRSGI